MKEEIVLFDIDKTIVSPAIILENFEKKLMRDTEIKEGDIIGIYKGYVDDLKSSSQKSTDFEPGEFIKRVSESTGIDSNDLNKAFYDPETWEDTLYPEVKNTLNRLKEMGKTLGINSEGWVSYQLAKLRLNGIENDFDKRFIFINRRKIEADFIKELPEGTTIIDDNKEVIEKLNTTGRFNLFWINRNTDEVIEGSISIKTIKNLDEIIDFVKTREVLPEAQMAS